MLDVSLCAVFSGIIVEKFYMANSCILEFHFGESVLCLCFLYIKCVETFVVVVVVLKFCLFLWNTWHRCKLIRLNDLLLWSGKAGLSRPGQWSERHTLRAGIEGLWSKEWNAIWQADYMCGWHENSNGEPLSCLRKLHRKTKSNNYL